MFYQEKYNIFEKSDIACHHFTTNQVKNATSIIQMPKINGEWKLRSNVAGGSQHIEDLMFDVIFDVKNEMIVDSGLFFFNVNIHLDELNWTISYWQLLSSRNVVRLDECKDELMKKLYQSPHVKAKADISVHIRRKVKIVLAPDHEFVSLATHWTKTGSFKGLRNRLVDLSDFTIIVGKQEYKVHKLYLAAASDVMRTMFVTNFEESRTNTATIVGIESEVFEILLHFIYGDKDQFMNAFKIELAFKVFAAAHQYDIEQIMNFCLVKIFDQFTDIDHVIETYSFACLYDVVELKLFCWEIIQYDILKFFIPMALEPPENIQKYLRSIQTSIEIKKKYEKSFQQNCQEMYSQVKLDEVLKPSTLKQYRDETMVNLDLTLFLHANAADSHDKIDQQDSEEVGRPDSKRIRHN